MNKDFNDLLFGFKEHLKVKHYSPKTLAAYGQHLQGFFACLREKNILELKRVSREDLKAYQLHLTTWRSPDNKGYAQATLSLKIRAVKRLFEYLEAIHYLLINPAEHIKEPKKERRLPRTILTEEEARKLLDQPNLSTMTGIRDRTLMELFYSTGIRLEELVNLTIYDCDLQGGLLRVNKGKGGKDRVIPLGKHAVKFLKEYITHVRPHHTRANKTLRNLFVNQNGKLLSPTVIEILVRNYAKAARLNKKVTPHVFRHTFATGLVKNGADVTAVQKMLGHSDLSVTQQYIRVAGVEIKKTHQIHHPREKDPAAKEEITPQIEGIRGPYRDD